MSIKSLAPSLELAITPDEVRTFFGAMKRGDLTEKAVEAVFLSRELQAFFDSMKAESESTTRHTLESDRHIVDLTDQILARDTGLEELKVKRAAEIDELQKAKDLLSLQISSKEEELKKLHGVEGHLRDEIETLQSKIREQEEVLCEFQSVMKADSDEQEKLQAQLSALGQDIQKIQEEKDSLRTACEQKERVIAEKNRNIDTLIAKKAPLQEAVEARGLQIAHHVAEEAAKDARIADLHRGTTEKDTEIARLNALVAKLREKNRRITDTASLRS